MLLGVHTYLANTQLMPTDAASMSMARTSVRVSTRPPLYHQIPSVGRTATTFVSIEESSPTQRRTDSISPEKALRAGHERCEGNRDRSVEHQPEPLQIDLWSLSTRL